jgi:hypothetical protein
MRPRAQLGLVALAALASLLSPTQLREVDMKKVLILLLTIASIQPCLAAAYFAELGKTRIKRVVVVSDLDAIDGEVFCHNLLGGFWKRTYIDGSQRGKYAGN